MKKTILMLCIILLSTSLFAQEEVIRKDGRTIIIYNNGTWKYKPNTPTVSKKESNLPNRSGEQFIGTWDYINAANSGAGSIIGLNIYKDGKIFIIDLISISVYEGRQVPPIVKEKAFTAIYKDESLELSSGSGEKIDFGTSSGHIFFRSKEFVKQ